MTTKSVRAHVFVAGRVQGVYFRQNTQTTAREHGLTGWVRNLPDGRVEAVIEGDEASVKKVIEWCRSGPPAASVDSIEIKHERYTGGFAGFEITD